MKGFLFDENLPSRLKFSPSLPVLPSSAVGASATDSELWAFARARELVVVTKDSDFSDRIIVSQPPPWVVHLRFGNMRRRESMNCSRGSGRRSSNCSRPTSS